MPVTIKIRSRLSSVGDSAPPSESSDGSTSETFEQNSDWNQTDQSPNSEPIYTGSADMHMLSPDTGGAISDNERLQVESFFSGLGTEVSELKRIFVRYSPNEMWFEKQARENNTGNNINHCLKLYGEDVSVNEKPKANWIYFVNINICE